MANFLLDCSPDLVDCIPPGSSVHGISQARILEWIAISFSRGSSRPKIKPRSPALQVDFLPTGLAEKPINDLCICGWQSLSTPQDIHVLIPGAYKYITFHDKGGLKVCQWSLGPNLELWSGDDPGLPRWFSESTRSLQVKKAGKRD